MERSAARWTLGLGIAAALGLAGCSSVVVRTDYDPDADFAPLQRFAWHEPSALPGANPFADNPLLRKRVREAVRAVLEARGYREAGAEEADFRVTFAVTVHERIGLYGAAYGDPYYGGWYRTNAVSYQRGTLILDVQSRDGSELLWRGWGTNAVPTADDASADVEESVTKILADFPPPPPRGALREGAEAR